MSWKRMELTGWGRSSRAPCWAARPERLGAARSAWSAPFEAGVIAHGGGRSYGDTALNTDGRVVLTGRLDRFLSFDAATGDVVVEPGVRFRDLIEVFLPRGWLAPVSPGTAFATIGGAVANDVHGKNHEADGTFGDHVKWIDLLLPSGETKRVSRDDDGALFAATLGGLGLTGLIVAVCFTLRRVPSNAVTVSEKRIDNLDAFLVAFDAARKQGRYSVGWIDALARGGSLGRGILEVAEPAEADVRARPRRDRKVPVDFPGFALNSLSVRAFNEAYWRRVPTAGREHDIGYETFLYPLDAIHEWNRIYGKRGFRQFQCAVPAEGGRETLVRLLEEISGGGSASFLAVLKALGNESFGHLSFPRPGYTLALDIPEKRHSPALFHRLETITREAGGRIYLAKDSCLSAEGFAAMYPRLPQFRDVLSRVDPGRHLQSDMARRLRIHGEPA